MADNGGSSSSCYEPCLDIPAVLKLKILQLFILWILQKYLISTKCMSYTIRVLSCFSSGTSTSWLTWALATTTRSTGPWRTSRRWSISLRPCTGAPAKAVAWSCPRRTTLRSTDTECLSPGAGVCPRSHFHVEKLWTLKPLRRSLGRDRRAAQPQAGVGLATVLVYSQISVNI